MEAPEVGLAAAIGAAWPFIAALLAWLAGDEEKPAVPDLVVQAVAGAAVATVASLLAGSTLGVLAAIAACDGRPSESPSNRLGTIVPRVLGVGGALAAVTAFDGWLPAWVAVPVAAPGLLYAIGAERSQRVSGQLGQAAAIGLVTGVIVREQPRGLYEGWGPALALVGAAVVCVVAGQRLLKRVDAIEADLTTEREEFWMAAVWAGAVAVVLGAVTGLAPGRGALERLSPAFAGATHSGADGRWWLALAALGVLAGAGLLTLGAVEVVPIPLVAVVGAAAGGVIYAEAYAVPYGIVAFLALVGAVWGWTWRQRDFRRERSAGGHLQQSADVGDEESAPLLVGMRAAMFVIAVLTAIVLVFDLLAAHVVPHYV